MSVIRSLQQQLQQKEISCVELTTKHLENAKEEQANLNSYNTITEDAAMSQAKFIDEQLADGMSLGLLAGIPYSVKDVYTTEGIASTGSSQILKDFIPPYSATVAHKIAQTGAILIGKNNCDEFAQGGTNEHSGFGPVKNPVHHDHIPGGSSGGSAASVANGSSVFSLGTDTGGSIRQPASYCGCVGLKVTYGLASRFGVMAMASSLDTMGPLTQTVEDAAIILEHIAGHDENDPTSLKTSAEQYSKFVTSAPESLTIGLPKEYLSDDIAPEVKQAVLDAAKQLEAAGHKITEVSLPMTKYAVAVYYILMPAEVTANMSRYDGLRYGPTISNPENLDQLYVQNRSLGFGSEVKRRILLGNFVLSHGYFDDYYKQAARVRTKVIQEFNQMFTQVDMLITPTAPTTAPKLGQTANNPLEEYLADVCTIPASIAGLPAISLPVAKDSNGLPIGAQLIGPRLSELQLLQAAFQLEQRLQ